MRNHSMRTYAACAVVMLVMTGRPVVAQAQSGGWPETKIEHTKAAKAPAA